MSYLMEHIEESLSKADTYDSTISHEILNLDGMSGKKTRHFYNNICSMNDARYLEIGTWKGSSICSAMYNNEMVCLAIDNWSEFGGPKDEFLVNFNKFKGQNNATFIEDNCWNIDVSELGKFNIYMYDGNHDESSHFRALNHYLPCLDSEFIYLIDDWDVDHVRTGTRRSIKDNNCEVLYEKEIFSAESFCGIQHGAINDWHNGICIYVLTNNQS